MRTYRAAVLHGVRAVALIGILPGAVVAAAYLLVLTQQLYRYWQLYREWDVPTALVLGLAAWGVLGVIGLWHEYVRLSRSRVGVERVPVSPRAVLFLWALIMVAVAGWKFDAHPWAAAFLALAALYSFARAFGLLRYLTRSPRAARRAHVAHLPSGARVREDTRSRARNSRTASGRERA